MKQYHNLQQRLPADSISTGAQISFQGDQYTLGQTIPKTLQPSNLPMGVIMNGYTEQFLLLKSDQPVGAAWFYFYGSCEGNRWAVLDAVEVEAGATMRA